MSHVDPPAMTLPLILLAMVVPLGALDVLYFHIWKFRLYRRPAARAEMVTHLLRGTVIPLIAYMLATYRFGGAWFWTVGALFLVEFLNSLADVALESRSRASLGGVPALEMVIHSVGSTFVGAIAAAFILVGWPGRDAPTALLPAHGSLPVWLVWQGELIAASGALLTLCELGLFLRWRGKA